ncbi:hypothetical protein CBM2626_A40103 [Cupriavidus taiwanensis]|nr:hypothetical protein CBM2626_A40103 [Cupriavidus taiwanensis]
MGRASRISGKYVKNIRHILVPCANAGQQKIPRMQRPCLP